MKKETQLTNEIKKLQYQLSYSEHINKELSQHLALLYDKTGIPPAKLKQTGDINVISTQTHLQELYYVQPLLMCYEETIYLLKNEMEELKQESETIQQQVGNILKQNSFLRKELEGKIELLKKGESFGVSVNFLTLENKDLKEKISVGHSKNQYLLRKNKELEDDLNRMVKEKLGMYGEQQIRKVEISAREEHKLIQTKNIELSSEIQIVKNQLQNQRSVIAEYERKVTEYEAELTKVRNQLRVCKQQVDNQQTLHEGVEDNLTSEMATLKDQLKAAQRKQQQIFTKNMTLESQLQDKNNKAHNLAVQNTQLQANNNNMLQMLESYEVKVSTLNKKIKKLEGDIKQTREEGGQVNKKADIAEWKLAEKVQQLERKQIQWKKERSRIAQMWEQRLQALRKSYESQVPSRD